MDGISAYEEVEGKNGKVPQQFQPDLDSIHLPDSCSLLTEMVCLTGAGMLETCVLLVVVGVGVDLRFGGP